ncbi:hypothetical protein J1N35_024991 [Gossypium stocksii]|uniref:Uncharacterized protein n=1 Tax=Gossypium stocksii TaxID=47602 RepID=A0A9D3ZXV9_9ROSI|nr:hypothetical protein J1N35_024991 [Gossypium stocksii]
MDMLQTLLNTIVGKLMKKNETLKVGMIVIKEENEVVVMTLNTKIEELKRELIVYRIKDDDAKVNTASMYFTDVAFLWWRHRFSYEKRGGTEIVTWEEF